MAEAQPRNTIDSMATRRAHLSPPRRATFGWGTRSIAFVILVALSAAVVQGCACLPTARGDPGWKEGARTPFGRGKPGFEVYDEPDSFGGR